MTVYAISDLHLPAKEKPMDVFGAHWENHFDRISESWLECVTDDDIVLLPGDLTWAMRLEDALEDIARVAALPGTKVILRGNHDYWWGSIGVLRRSLPKNFFAIQNDAVAINGVCIAGSRGWTLPAADSSADDIKIYERERLRLNMSMTAAARIRGDMPLVAMMHYPPFSHACPGFSDILTAAQADVCVYGHLHGAGLASSVGGEKDGVMYHQVSCDGLGFKLKRILEI